MTANGSGLTGGTPAVTVSSTSQGGRLQTVTDPRGLVAKTDYDLLGQVVRTVEAFTDFVPSAANDRTTEYTYDGGGGHVVTREAILPGGAVQVTAYIYGVTTPTSNLNSKDLLAEVWYPDKTSGHPSDLHKESFTYNALGQTKTYSDRNGSVHTYHYDVVGRQTADAVTTLGAGVNGQVRCLATEYDSAGRPFRLTSRGSYDAVGCAGSVRNQVQQGYNGLGQLVREYQAHAAAVDTGSTPLVRYDYSFNGAGTANHSRLVKMTYPGGRELKYDYSGNLNDRISRLNSLTEGPSASTVTLEAYAYLGLGTVVERTHPQPSVNLTYVAQTGDPGCTPGVPPCDGGDQYRGLDRFGRVVDQRWTRISGPTDRFQYGYDRNGNRLYRDNLLDNNFDELYHLNGSSQGYDDLNQLRAFARGALNGSKDSIATPTYYQKWMDGQGWTEGNGASTLDALGNWTSVNTNGATQTRTHNRQNQTTRVGATTLTYDRNGNLTRDEAGRTLVYDAWDRLVQVKSGATVLATYSYDVLGRRVTETVDGTTRVLYYSSAWQVLEERGGAAIAQYVWSPVYVDALVLRDQGGQRLYVQQDANWNVTALVNAAGSMVERYVYSPYGSATVLAPDWTVRSSSTVGWVYLHQGGRFEAVTGLYHFRQREYSPALGRWLQNDPVGYQVGMNRYAYNAGNPASLVDPTGREPVTLSLALAVGAGFAIGAIAGWIISEDYSGYRNLGLNRFEATVASVASNTPVVGAGWALGEMGGGRSLRGSDYGKELTGWDYAFRGASVVLDVGAPFISKLLPGASNSLKVAPSATRGRLFRTNLSPSNERLFEGGLNAAQDAFDPMLSQLFKETGTGKFQGIWLNRFKPTQFHDVDLAIYFQREAHLTGRVIGEEVQHAIDFAMGATKQRVIREALTHTTAEQAVDWWHRRVFTRLLQNTHRDQFGLGVLRPYMNDIHQAYQNVGGRLSMDEILRRQFSGIF